MAKPCEIHLKVAKKVLWYFKGIINLGIMYIDEYDVELACFSNSVWARNLDDRRPTTGYAFNIGLGSCHGVARNNKLFLCYQ